MPCGANQCCAPAVLPFPAVGTQPVTLRELSVSFGDPGVAWLVVYWRRGSFLDNVPLSSWTPLAPPGLSAFALPRLPSQGASAPRLVPEPLGITVSPGDVVSFFLIPGNGNWIANGALPADVTSVSDACPSFCCCFAGIQPHCAVQARYLHINTR